MLCAHGQHPFELLLYLVYLVRRDTLAQPTSRYFFRSVLLLEIKNKKNEDAYHLTHTLTTPHKPTNVSPLSNGHVLVRRYPVGIGKESSEPVFGAHMQLQMHCGTVLPVAPTPPEFV